MSYVVFILNWLIGLFFGSFSLCNILLPIFVTIPFFRQLKRHGRLAKPIPLGMIVAGPIFWLLASCALGAFYYFKFIHIFPYFIMGYIFASFGVIKRCIKGLASPDVNADFAMTYGDYIKQQDDVSI